MGDKNHAICVLDWRGQVVGEPRWATLRAIWDNAQKNDVRDAEMLARIARFDPQLLHPIRHRGKEAQCDLAALKTRDELVKVRTALIAHVRGLVKSFGERLPKCSPECFHLRAAAALPADLAPAREPVVQSIAELTVQIRRCDQLVEKLSQEKYPETEALRAIPGVGPVTALACVLTLEDNTRFEKSRDVGPFLGLTPRRDQAGRQAIEDHQGGRRLSAAPVGAMRPLHPGAPWSRLRLEAVRPEVGRARREKRQAPGRRGGGPQAGRAVALPLEDRRRLRTGPPPEPEVESSLEKETREPLRCRPVCPNQGD